ncbi:MAG: MogA/MoaB family molybdenum cofactor biosynthesis protein [Candidatus Choladocola sp.]|nr:MogA/MoaB family molybdenum cofactor biosynthesis protein [Candidatus Choladocola sp.]
MGKVRVAIIVSSDSSYRGTREDLSGPEIRRIVEAYGYQVVSCKVLPDEQELLEAEMRMIADENLAELILTTGGTGFAERDRTPEATASVCQRMVPGIPEAMRLYSMQFTKRAMLSRSAAGIRKRTLIVNLPGSPKAVRECLEYIITELDHGIAVLTGDAADCARK